MAVHTKAFLKQRRREFNAACIYLGESQGNWASRHGISIGHLRNILFGSSESERVDRAIVAYIQKFRATVTQHYEAAVA